MKRIRDRSNPWPAGLIFLLPGLILNSCAGKNGDGDEPNVIIILADDLGCGDMSLYNGWIKTPRLDQMAREGVWFRDFHSNGSVCSPTRAALMTGRYQQRVGIVDVITNQLGTPSLDSTELTIPRLMKESGYRTALFGKWQLGGEPENNPTKFGFDEFIGFLPGGSDYLRHKEWYDGTEKKEQVGYSTHIITEKSIDFIKRNLDGISIKEHLLNQADIPDRQVFFGYEPKLGTAMRDGDWKMLTKGDSVELYDLSQDIMETTNIADKHPERTEKMKEAIDLWKLEVTPVTTSQR